MSGYYCLSGTLDAAGGLLRIAESVSGKGITEIGGADTLSLLQGASSGQIVDLRSVHANLDLADASDFMCWIAGFGGSDVTDLLRIGNRFWLVLLSLVPPHPAATEAATSPAATQKASAIAKHMPFDIQGWAILSGQPDELVSLSRGILAPGRVTDGSETRIVVHGARRLRFAAPDMPGYEPADSDASMPRDVRIVPPTECSNMAYNTIAGQPATGKDLIGFLGSAAQC